MNIYQIKVMTEQESQESGNEELNYMIEAKKEEQNQEPGNEKLKQAVLMVAKQGLKIKEEDRKLFKDSTKYQFTREWFVGEKQKLAIIHTPLDIQSHQNCVRVTFDNESREKLQVTKTLWKKMYLMQQQLPQYPFIKKNKFHLNYTLCLHTKAGNQSIKKQIRHYKIAKETYDAEKNKNYDKKYLIKFKNAHNDDWIMWRLVTGLLDVRINQVMISFPWVGYQLTKNWLVVFISHNYPSQIVKNVIETRLNTPIQMIPCPKLIKLYTTKTQKQIRQILHEVNSYKIQKDRDGAKQIYKLTFYQFVTCLQAYKILEGHGHQVRFCHIPEYNQYNRYQTYEYKWVQLNSSQNESVLLYCRPGYK